MTEKTPAHQASETAVQAAQERVATARTAEVEASARIRAATAAKDALLARSAAGEGVTAEQIRTAEEATRDAEIQHQFAAAALRGAVEGHRTASADLRIEEQAYYKRAHAELVERQVRIAKEADELLTAALAKLAEYDEAKGEFQALRQAADASLAAPLWPPATINSPRDPLPLPISQHNVSVKITTSSGGFEHQFHSLQHALGHGRPAAAA